MVFVSAIGEFSFGYERSSDHEAALDPAAVGKEYGGV
jgi:hypothetical protein